MPACPIYTGIQEINRENKAMVPNQKGNKLQLWSDAKNYYLFIVFE